MLDATQVLQDVEELLELHYLTVAPVQTQPAPVALQPSRPAPNGVTELLGNLAFLFVLSVLDQSLAGQSAR